MTDHVRTCSFEKSQFQQMQVDIEYLRVELTPIIGNERLFNALLTDVLSVAYSQCTNPILLDKNVSYI